MALLPGMTPTKLIKPPTNPADAINKQTDANIEKAFAARRLGSGAAQAANAQNLENDISRQEAASGGGFGGASVMLRQKAQTQAAQGFEGERSDLAGQEAEAKANQGNIEAAQKLQNQQFNQTMQYQFAELDENKKTNIINSITALKDAGLMDKYNKDKFKREGIQGLFPGLAATSKDREAYNNRMYNSYWKQGGGGH